MGVVVEWKKPESETSYDNVRVYRATSSTGTYSLIGTVTNIATTYYYDETGTTNHWYKIDFYHTATTTASALSDAIQGGRVNGYCSPDDVRDLTNLTTSDLTDTEIWRIIKFAGAQVNADMNTEFIDETIGYNAIDRENCIDGSNVCFWTKHYPIGDFNDDMLINTCDVEVSSIDSAGLRTAATVACVCSCNGFYCLSAAPTTDKTWIVTYKHSPVRVDTPNQHKLVKLACTFLSAAYAFSKINVGKAPSVSMGNVRFLRHMDSFDEFYTKYEKIMSKVNGGMVDTVEGDLVL